MGQLASKVIRKANRFNVENRAHRVLEREKPTPAPKFDSNLRDMERTLEREIPEKFKRSLSFSKLDFIITVDPKFVDKLNAKDATLDSRLKDVYVTSQDRFVGYRNGKCSGQILIFRLLIRLSEFRSARQRRRRQTQRRSECFPRTERLRKTLNTVTWSLHVSPLEGVRCGKPCSSSMITSWIRNPGQLIR